jgi:glutamate-ammonia-ligase adenylyltransferase
MALVRARPVAGDRAVGAAFEAVLAPFLWGWALAAEELEQILHAKERIERERAQTAHGAVDLKLGPGGINDIEFCVQLLQLAHGRDDPGVRAPGTLAGLRALVRSGRLPSGDEARRLEAAYLFLRRTEARRQLMHDWQESTISPAAGGFEALARLLEYEDSPEHRGAADFEADLRRHQAAAREIFEATVARLRETSAGEVARVTRR